MGDERVTNGAWAGRVLAEHDGWVWVLPTASMTNRELIEDGPLTFRADALSPLATPSQGDQA